MQGSRWVGWVILGVTALAVAGCASAPRADRGRAAADAEFARRVAEMESGAEVDFLELRRAFTATSAYSPYFSTVIDDREKAMYEALGAKNYEQAGRLAAEILEASPIYPDARFVAYVAAKESDDAEGAEKARQIVAGLFDSISAGGDCRDREHPCWVLATYEEYFLMHLRHLELRKQALTRCAGVACDVMTVVDSRTGEEQTLYFDVSTPMGYLDQQLSH